MELPGTIIVAVTTLGSESTPRQRARVGRATGPGQRRALMPVP